MHQKGMRRMIFYMPIELHEIIKKLANECTPPISQGSAANTLLTLGIEAYFEKAKEKGGEKMPSNTVLINGVTEYIVGDSKMDAVIAVLKAVSGDPKTLSLAPDKCREVPSDEPCDQTCS